MPVPMWCGRTVGGYWQGSAHSYACHARVTPVHIHPTYDPHVGR